MNQTALRKAIETVIQREFPTSTLHSLSFKPGSNPGDNFLGVLYAIDFELRNNRGALERRHLFLKTSPEGKADKELTSNLQLFQKEISFYCDVVPELLKFQENRTDGKILTEIFVECYTTSIASQSSEKQKSKYLPWDYLLMPDLREEGGYRMLNRGTPLDFDHCKLIISELAKYHALTYAYMKTLKCPAELFAKFPHLKEGIFTPRNESKMKEFYEIEEDSALEVLSKAFPIDSDEYQNLKRVIKGTFRIVSHYLAGSNDLSLAEMLATPVDLTDVNLAERERKERNQWLVLAHGDLYSNNLLFKYSDEKPTAVKLIDFQLVGENCLTMDLVYLLYTSTTVDLRRKYLDQLLGIYYDAFTDVCKVLKVEPWVDFTSENLSQKHRNSMIFGASHGMTLLPNLLQGVDPEILETRLISTAKECLAQGIFD